MRSTLFTESESGAASDLHKLTPFSRIDGKSDLRVKGQERPRFLGEIEGQ